VHPAADPYAPGASDAALEALVRRFDENRWLASRFAARPLRARLIALYALNHEIARAAEAGSQALLAQMRLHWWREAVIEILDGRAARAHPALGAFARAARAADFPREAFEALFAARTIDSLLRPFADRSELDAYVDATAGGIVLLALSACGARAEKYAGLARATGRAWGFAGLARAAPYWRERGRSLSPHSEAMSEPEFVAGLGARALEAHAQARALSRAAPAEVMPAIAYASLVPMLMRAPDRARSLLARQWRLVGAVALGRL